MASWFPADSVHVVLKAKCAPLAIAANLESHISASALVCKSQSSTLLEMYSERPAPTALNSTKPHPILQSYSCPKEVGPIWVEPCDWEVDKPIFRPRIVMHSDSMEEIWRFMNAIAIDTRSIRTWSLNWKRQACDSLARTPKESVWRSLN